MEERGLLVRGNRVGVGGEVFDFDEGLRPSNSPRLRRSRRGPPAAVFFSALTRQACGSRPSSDYAGGRRGRCVARSDWVEFFFFEFFSKFFEFSRKVSTFGSLFRNPDTKIGYRE